MASGQRRTPQEEGEGEKGESALLSYQALVFSLIAR